MSSKSYPLNWPIGYPITQNPVRSNFKTTFDQARKGVIKELELMEASNIVISTNIPLRKDGFPYGRYAEPEDKGVAVYFTWDKEQYVLACDKWDLIQDNMQSIRKSIEAIRGLDRWGSSEFIKRSFAGFKALPESGSGKAWWEVLNISSEATQGDIIQAYRSLIKKAHPDAGGSADQVQVLNEARKQGLESLSGKEYGDVY